MNILQLSDIHFGRSHPEYHIPDHFEKHDQILDELLDVIDKLDDGLKPEHIVVTGDIAWHGKQEEFEEAKTFFKRLLKVSKLNGEDITFCVGNHDVDFANICLEERLDNWSIEKIDNYYKYENALILEPGIFSYNEFCKDMGMIPYFYPTENGNGYSYSVGWKDLTAQNGSKIRIVSFNTSMLIATGISEDMMWLGQKQLDALVEKGVLPSADDVAYTIALFHHPDRFLHPNETSSYDGRPATLPKLAEYANLLLCGHTESAGKPRVLHQGCGGTIFSAGATYYSDTHQNSFSMIYISEKKKKMGFLPYIYDNGWKDYEFGDNSVKSLHGIELTDTEPVLKKIILHVEFDDRSMDYTLKNTTVEEDDGKLKISNRADIMTEKLIEFSEEDAVLKVSIPERTKRSARAVLSWQELQKQLKKAVCYSFIDENGVKIAEGEKIEYKKQLPYTDDFLNTIINIEDFFRIHFPLPDSMSTEELTKVLFLNDLVNKGYSSHMTFPESMDVPTEVNKIKDILSDAEGGNPLYLQTPLRYTLVLFGVQVWLNNTSLFCGPYKIDIDDAKYKAETGLDGDIRLVKYSATVITSSYFIYDKKSFDEKHIVCGTLIDCDSKYLGSKIDYTKSRKFAAEKDNITV